MLNYLQNNLVLINEYQELYKNGIDIDRLLDKFRAGALAGHKGYDYGRFEVFIDSCMLLLNKEKLNHYAKNKYSFKGFFDHIHGNEDIKSYLELVKHKKISADISGYHLYYSLDGKKKTPWDQVATIRNAMAHMQYGNFMSQGNGFMLYYFLYNKDHGICKDWGIVFEPVLHDFVQRFFSNYSYGILFKFTFFSKYSFEAGRKKRTLHYYEVTCNRENMKVYDGYNTNLISELAYLYRDTEKFFAFLESRKKDINISEIPVKKAFKIRRYRKLAKRFKLRSKQEFVSGLKVLLNFEEVLSNFLVHIGQLNQALYQCSALRHSPGRIGSEMEEYQKEWEDKIRELSEDRDERFAFEIGFIYLKAMNFALRTEDEDDCRFDYSDVDVSMFDYDKNALENYIKKQNIGENELQHYVIARMRNALMHGHLEVALSKKGEAIFVFSDIYNKREEKIECSSDKMSVFLSQGSLYHGVPKKTNVLIAESN